MMKKENQNSKRLKALQRLLSGFWSNYYLIVIAAIAGLIIGVFIPRYYK